MTGLGLLALMLTGAVDAVGVDMDIPDVSVSVSAWDSYHGLPAPLWHTRSDWQAPRGAHGWAAGASGGDEMMEAVKAYMYRMINESQTRSRYYQLFPTPGAAWQRGGAGAMDTDIMGPVKAYMYRMINESQTRGRYYRVFE